VGEPSRRDAAVRRRAHPHHRGRPELLVEGLCDVYGIDQQAGGERVSKVLYNVGRWLLPEAVELTQRREPHLRGISRLNVHDAKRIPRMLAGQVPPPAAITTCAGWPTGACGSTCSRDKERSGAGRVMVVARLPMIEMVRPRPADATRLAR
jgi:hypothetical protein